MAWLSCSHSRLPEKNKKMGWGGGGGRGPVPSTKTNTSDGEFNLVRYAPVSRSHRTEPISMTLRQQNTIHSAGRHGFHKWERLRKTNRSVILIAMASSPFLSFSCRMKSRERGRGERGCSTEHTNQIASAVSEPPIPPSMANWGERRKPNWTAVDQSLWQTLITLEP